MNEVKPDKMIASIETLMHIIETGAFVKPSHLVFEDAKKEIEAYKAGKPTGPANDITTPVLFAKNVKLLLETLASYSKHAKAKNWVVAGPLQKKAGLLKTEIAATADEIILGCSQGKLL